VSRIMAWSRAETPLMLSSSDIVVRVAWSGTGEAGEVRARSAPEARTAYTSYGAGKFERAGHRLLFAPPSRPRVVWRAPSTPRMTFLDHLHAAQSATGSRLC